MRPSSSPKAEGRAETISVRNKLTPEATPMSLKKFVTAACLIVIVLGIGFRFYRITDNTFVFYDEGMWLLQNQSFVRHIEQSAGEGLSKIGSLLNISFHLSLQTGKALWAFISQSRGFFVGEQGYYFNRVVSAIFGTLSIAIVYFFANRLYQSRWIGLLSASLLAVLPSHVFYSRLALQEGLSVCLFLLGMYLYVFPRRMTWRVFAASMCFAGVFFANYRMIIIPFFVALTELYMSLAERRRPEYEKYVYHTLLFLLIVFGIGALDGGANTFVTFGWMFHQTHLAKGTFDWVNLLSYPYYIYRFEGLLFAVLFFLNLILVVRGKFKEAYPFVLIMVFMLVFSIPQEKGVRYLTSGYPFMAMAVAAVVGHFVTMSSRAWIRRAVLVLVGLSFIVQIGRCLPMAGYSNDYATSIRDAVEQDPSARFVSTQAMVQRLYVEDASRVAEFRYGIAYLEALRRQGYSYLMIDPQAYVSFTDDKRRFTPKLKGYLEFIRHQVNPVQTYPHFAPALLERFVLEHNENLRQSIAFLNMSEANGFGELRVYDIQTCMQYLQRGLLLMQQRRGNNGL